MMVTKRILRGLTWLHYDRHYRTSLRPFRLLWIDPDQISRYPVQTPSIYRWVPSGVVGGSWDQELRRFENGITFRSFRKHFIDGDDWTSTPYYRFALEQIEEKGTYKGYTTPEGIKRRCEQLDNLYEEISDSGYRTQRDLDLSGDIELHRHLHLPPEMREVTVHITRTGEFLWRGGAHRLAIAKLLQLEKIPVRICVRHEKWQERRDRAVHDGLQKDQHPDLPCES